MEVAYDGVAYYATNRLSRDQIQGMERQPARGGCEGRISRHVGFFEFWSMIDVFAAGQEGGLLDRNRFKIQFRSVYFEAEGWVSDLPNSTNSPSLKMRPYISLCRDIG